MIDRRHRLQRVRVTLHTDIDIHKYTESLCPPLLPHLLSLCLLLVVRAAAGACPELVVVVTQPQLLAPPLFSLPASYLLVAAAASAVVDAATATAGGAAPVADGGSGRHRDLVLVLHRRPSRPAPRPRRPDAFISKLVNENKFNIE